MQSPLGINDPIGVVYNTSMDRPDAALTLCALYGFDGKREARVGSICVTGAGLNAAIFCDIVGAGLYDWPRADFQYGAAGGTACR